MEGQDNFSKIKFPISHHFISTKQLDLDDDTKITVLVLDEKENIAYWKLRYSFATTIVESKLEKQEDAKSWYISTAFIQICPDAITDLISEMPATEQNTIYGIPFTLIEDEQQFCVLELVNGTKYFNQYFK
jgi:hypothetical protein